MAEGYKTRMLGDGNPNRRLAKKKCPVCGAMFAPLSHLTVHCSSDCAFKNPKRAITARKNGMKSNRPCRRDLNQNAIVDAFRKLGAGVIDLSQQGGGCPDLIVSHGGETYLVEVKNPETYYGRSGLSKSQIAWASEWRGGPVYIVYTIEDALAIVERRTEDIKSFGGGSTCRCVEDCKWIIDELTDKPTNN
jgi:Holliday junction resolvase